MTYLIIAKVIYLSTYYLTLRNRPSGSYKLSLMIACTTSLFHTYSLLLHLLHNKDGPANFPFEALLSHGLSYEEWRTAEEVKRKMDAVQLISKGQNNLPEDVYLFLLLTLSFLKFIKFRAATPEEKLGLTIKFPKVGDKLLTLGISEERTVTESESAIFESIRQRSIRALRDKHYKSTNLSRLVYEGIDLVFKKEPLGPRLSKKAESYSQVLKTYSSGRASNV